MLLVLFACAPAPVTPVPKDGADTACVETSWFRDTDGDGVGDASRGTATACAAPEGYAAIDGDCDDFDATRFPGAPEVCDHVDQDCDGAFDEDAVDAPVWHADADGDGFGAADEGLSACERVAARVEDASDCDDADATAFPGAPERCDGADDDCDGAVDEDAEDAAAWYPDADGDGFGDPGSVALACAAPDGFVASPTDCDDADPLASPAGVETCDGTDEDCDGAIDADAVDAPTWYADGDGFGDPAVSTAACDVPPGFGPDATDCDDADPAVSPAAAERCNDADDDCDGAVDDAAIDPSRWYADTDADGFGDPAVSLLACDAPAGYGADATDCDDTTAAVSPAAVEVCNGADDDCDGAVDGDAIDPATWYADTDGDGFGDLSRTILACDAPAGYVADPTDCDDADAATSPAGVEVCGGADEDCDGITDEDDAADALVWYRDADVDGRGDPGDVVTSCVHVYGYVDNARDCDDTNPLRHADLAEDCATPFDDDCDGDAVELGAPGCVAWYADADGDTYGDPAASSCQCAGDATYVVTDGEDCDDADATVFPGAEEVWGDGVDQSCGGDGDAAALEDEAVRLWGTSAGAYAGFSVAGGDIDGDGLDDLVVGAPYLSPVLRSEGGVYVRYGAPTADEPLPSADARLFGRTTSARTGTSVSVGDLDGDGLGDVAIGAPGLGAALGGGAYVVTAPGTGLSYTDDVADVTVTCSPLRVGAGGYVGLDGDLDGDGADELVVTGLGWDGGAGVVFVFSAPSGAIGTGVATATLTGDATDAVGSAGARVGDLDGDGLDDLAIGARGWKDGTGGRGAVYLIYGMPGDGALADVADVRITGVTATLSAGASLASAGDLDGDGLPELLVGATGSPNGAVYVVSAPFPATFAGATSTLTSGAGWSDLGTAVAGGHDLDGDGVPDVAVSEPYATFSGYALGAVHVLTHVPAGTVDLSDAALTLQGTYGSFAGNSVALLDDVDGDGLADLLVGAAYEDFAGDNAGAAWLFYGR